MNYKISCIQFKLACFFAQGPIIYVENRKGQFIQRRLDQLYPNPPIPLDHKSSFQLLVAVLLSAQCTDKRVNEVTPSLFAKASDAYAMTGVPTKEIYQIIRPCGLAPKKSAAISELSRILVKKYGCNVPESFPELSFYLALDTKQQAWLCLRVLDIPPSQWILIYTVLRKGGD